MPGLGKPLEKEITTCSSITAWEIPWTEELHRLQSMGGKRVGLNLVTTQQQTIWIKVNRIPYDGGPCPTWQPIDHDAQESVVIITSTVL